MLSVFVIYIPIPICVNFISGGNIGVCFRCVLHTLHMHKQRNKCVRITLFLYAHDDLAYFFYVFEK